MLAGNRIVVSEVGGFASVDNNREQLVVVNHFQLCWDCHRAANLFLLLRNPVKVKAIYCNQQIVRQVNQRLRFRSPFDLAVAYGARVEIFTLEDFVFHSFLDHFVKISGACILEVGLDVYKVLLSTCF